MADKNNDETDTRQELREVEESLRRLRAEDTTPPDGPMDQGDMASALAQGQEQAALIEALESRRDRLRRRLGEE